MACLYSPYSFNRVADGGFCDPVRILLTVLSAWLNTLSEQWQSISTCSPDPHNGPSTPGLPPRAYSTYPRSRTWRRCDAGGATPLLMARPSSKSAGKADRVGRTSAPGLIYRKARADGDVEHGDGC